MPVYIYIYIRILYIGTDETYFFYKKSIRDIYLYVFIMMKENLKDGNIITIYIIYMLCYVM